MSVLPDDITPELEAAVERLSHTPMVDRLKIGLVRALDDGLVHIDQTTLLDSPPWPRRSVRWV